MKGGGDAKKKRKCWETHRQWPIITGGWFDLLKINRKRKEEENRGGPLVKKATLRQATHQTAGHKRKTKT